MNLEEVLSFLLPQSGDILQAGFLTIILLMMGLTIISAHLTARPASWERKWNRGTPHDLSDDLDIEHGSVTDLWHAVATAPEKLAEIMPGMLLVVGLLGTFLGLGLALNHASNILGQPNALSASGAASSMQDLLGLLQGLGTKFKTSTWGITGFVMLKIWSETTRFEEKRLTWVIAKVKTELDNRKQAQSAAEAAKLNALFAEIGNAANTLVQTFATEISRVIDSTKLSHQHTLHFLGKSITGIREDLRQIQVDTQSTHASMAEFTEGTQRVIGNMAETAQQMATGADKIGDAAHGLNSTIEAFQNQFTEVLDTVRTDLGRAINDMSAQASETLTRGSAQLGAATKEISVALGVLSADVKETMGEVKGSIAQALAIQEKSAREFTLSSQCLNENIAATTGIVDKLGKPIEDGLRSVADAGQHMRGIGKTLERSIKSMEEVAVQLTSLPVTLEALKHLPANHEALLSALGPFKAFSEQHESVLGEIQGLRADMAASARTEDITPHFA